MSLKITHQTSDRQIDEASKADLVHTLLDDDGTRTMRTLSAFSKRDLASMVRAIRDRKMNEEDGRKKKELEEKLATIEAEKKDAGFVNAKRALAHGALKLVNKFITELKGFVGKLHKGDVVQIAYYLEWETEGVFLASSQLQGVKALFEWMQKECEEPSMTKAEILQTLKEWADSIGKRAMNRAGDGWSSTSVIANFKTDMETKAQVRLYNLHRNALKNFQKDMEAEDRGIEGFANSHLSMIDW